MRILVAGGTGYIGGALIPALLGRGHAVRVLARPRGTDRRLKDVEIVRGDALNEASVAEAMLGIDVVYYLIHSMRAGARAFDERDRQAARNFARAARVANVRRIVYLGGLGGADSDLSMHLRSRHEVGRILRSQGVPVTELRAAMVIGAGSASFEMMRYLTERLPVMIAPRWVATRCQPIAARDVIDYLVSTLELDGTAGRTYEIGGADVLSYADAMHRFARIRGLKRLIVPVPLFTPRLSSYWVHVVTPVSADIARPLIDGLHNELVVTDAAALRDFSIRPMSFEEAVREALAPNGSKNGG